MGLLSELDPRVEAALVQAGDSLFGVEQYSSSSRPPARRPGWQAARLPAILVTGRSKVNTSRSSAMRCSGSTRLSLAVEHRADLQRDARAKVERRKRVALGRAAGAIPHEMRLAPDHLGQHAVFLKRRFPVPGKLGLFAVNGRRREALTLLIGDELGARAGAEGEKRDGKQGAKHGCFQV